MKPFLDQRVESVKSEARCEEGAQGVYPNLGESSIG